MIELPEVETIRRDLDRDCVGRKVKNIEVRIARIAGGTSIKPLIEKSFDQEKVVSVRRIGMLICIDFSMYSLSVVCAVHSSKVMITSAPRAF